MPQGQITLLKGDAIGVETDYRDNLPVNMSGVMRPMFGAQGYMLEQPGIVQLGAGSGIDRGGVWNERFEDHYRVSGNRFISVTKNGAISPLGEITGVTTASLPYSFNTQGIVADGRFWLYDPAGGFREVTDPDLGDPIDGVWINGVYIFTDGEFLYRTNVADESQIDPLKFATAEFSPDPTLGVGKTTDNKLIAFGRYSTEYFRANPVDPNFSYARIESRAIKAGPIGTHAKIEIEGMWYVLGGRKEEGVSIHRLGVGSIENVASREVHKLIGIYQETQLGQVVMEAREQDNYHYLIAHLPNETLLFNITLAKAVGIEQAWSILKTDTDGDAQWRAKHGIFDPRLGKWVYGDKIDDRIGFLDESLNTHYGEQVEWLLYTPFILLESASIDEFQIEIMPGHTLADDATVFFSLTYDGVTFGKEYTLDYGAPSGYNTRFIARRLGYVSNWFGLKLRGVSTSRMGFSRGLLNYG